MRELDTLGIAYHSPGLRAYADELAAGVCHSLSPFSPSSAACGVTDRALHLVFPARACNVHALWNRGQELRPLQKRKARLMNTRDQHRGSQPGRNS